MKLILTVMVIMGVVYGVDTVYAMSPNHQFEVNYQKSLKGLINSAYLPYRNHYASRHNTRRHIRGFPRRIAATGQSVFIFSPRLKRWAAYDANGVLQNKGVANGGSHYCSDLGRPCRTPGGIYRVHSRRGANCVSNKFPLGRGGAAMPYCMFFKGGYAIHGSPYISNVNGSHGCIRVRTDKARWLYNNFMKPGTKVLVLPY